MILYSASRWLVGAIVLSWCLVVAGLKGAQGVTDQEIVIGSSLPLEGGFADVGQDMRRGMEACFKRVNDAGGIQGRKLKLVAYNDGYEPVPCVQNTLKLIDEDKVFALCSYVGTPTAVKAMKVWQSKQVPVVGFYTGAGALRAPFSPYNIHVRASYAREASAIVEAFSKQAGVKKVAVFYQNDAFGEAVRAVTEAALAQAGLSPAGYGTYERNALDIDKGLKDVAAAGPDAVVMVGTYAPLAKFVKAAKAAGMQKVLFHTVSFVGPEALAKALGADSERVFVTQVMPPFAGETAPIVSEFQEALKQAAPGAEATFPALEGYANAKVLCEGLRKAGKDLSVEALLKGIESIGAGREGVGLDVAYGPNDHEGLEAVFVTHLVGGKYEVVKDWSGYRR